MQESLQHVIEYLKKPVYEVSDISNTSRHDFTVPFDMFSQH